MTEIELRTIPDADRLERFLEQMLLIRHFEQAVEERYRDGEIPGFVHLAIGQEAVAVGVCSALESGDVFTSTHRSHAHALAKGTSPRAVMAELYGKLEGCSHGRGGSMHLYDVERGNLGSSAVVAGSLGIATGAALSFKLRGEPRVALAFFGDGATNSGMFHEAMNLAQLWKLPAVFLCENNLWAESTPLAQHSPIADLSERARAFGMAAIEVDGQDVEAVHDAALEALAHARSGTGPVFLVAATYRLTSHNVGDQQEYRDKAEYEQTREAHDPITALRRKLAVSDERLAELERQAEATVLDAVEFARNGTDPDPRDLLEDVYA
ncbi:MAG: thiamine pyrophosphate-dependent dehydrogenase E1 component subunit alpha [Gaiellaceae bacterium]|jgi:pyruvate dehydrogenase E1 component alpha subunit